MSNMILVALQNLDKSNDDHWTTDGMPRLDIVRTLSGQPELSRKQLIDVAPDFTRAMANEAEEEKPVEPSNELVEAVTTSEPEGENEPESDYDWFMGSTRQDLFATPESMTRAQKAISVIIRDWHMETEVLKKKITNLGNLSGQLTNALVVTEKGKLDEQPIQKYLKRQAEVRAERAATAKRFLDQGVNAQDLAKQISGKSPLDAAMNQRKPKLGSTRPDPRMPVRGTRQAG